MATECISGFKTLRSLGNKEFMFRLNKMKENIIYNRIVY